MKLYVGNLSFRTEEQELEALFASVGQVSSCSLVRDRATGQSRGFAFVDMANDAQGQGACAALDQREFGGRRLTVNEARPQRRNSGGGFNGPRQRRDSRW